MWEAHEENEGKTVEDRETLMLLKNSISLSFARESHNLYLDDTMNLFISLHHWIDWLKHYYVHSISVVSYFSFFFYSFDLMFFLHSVFIFVFIMFSLMNGSIWNTIWIGWPLLIFWATLRFLNTSLQPHCFFIKSLFCFDYFFYLLITDILPIFYTFSYFCP